MYQGQVLSALGMELHAFNSFHAFLSSADVFQINFFEKFFQEYHQSDKHIVSRSGHFVGPDLDPNCFQK